MATKKRQLVKKIFITAKLTAITGLRIGDNKENVEIGGVDNPVVRRKDNQEPYIPGSSLKGKMRCMLELATGKNVDSKSQNDGNTIIPRLFGAGENTDKTKRLDAEKKTKTDAASTPEEKKALDKEYSRKRSKYESVQSRLIVRDAYLTRPWAEKLKDSEHTDMPYTEIKWENVINRLKGTAEHPRQMERVPAGAKFELNFIINIFDGDGDGEDLLECLESGRDLLQADYLGGSGTRGYGQVEIEDWAIVTKDIEDYLSESLKATLPPSAGENANKPNEENPKSEIDESLEEAVSQ